MTSKATAAQGQAAEDRPFRVRPFGQMLADEISAATGLRKSDRTRLRITAAKVLEEQGFHNLRVGDVCKLAGVSQGTFYLYFENKSEVACAVLKDFNARGLDLLRARGPSTTPWRAISTATLTLTWIYSQNPGLMRSLWQINDKTPEFGEILRDANAVWIKALARSIVRRCGLGGHR